VVRLCAFQHCQAIIRPPPFPEAEFGGAAGAKGDGRGNWAAPHPKAAACAAVVGRKVAQRQVGRPSTPKPWRSGPLVGRTVTGGGPAENTRLAHTRRDRLAMVSLRISLYRAN
jgi:hypothetical protein